MKKLGLLIVPLLIVPFLTNCNGLGTPKPLEECTWELISKVSKAGKASEWFKVGDTKTIKVNNQDHQVRIIGFDQDVDKDGNKIGITFEFANLISDENGYSLATYWENTNSTDDANHDYKNSSIRKALTKNGKGDLHWFEKDSKTFSTNPEYANKSVLEMLPDELSNVLATPSKYINIDNGGGWDEQTVEDKLFLLSPAETRENEHDDEEIHTTTYSYYEASINTDRIKHQTKWHEGARIEFLSGKDLDGEYSIIKYSYAGYNSPTENYGGNYWLRSPNKSNNICAFNINYDGSFNHQQALFFASAIAPAFCI